MSLPQRSRSASALLGHKQSNTKAKTNINATMFGEILATNGAKSSSFTYTAEGLVETIVLTYDVNGSDVTKTYTFSYSGTQLAGFTIT